jgi:hypothetical protein
MNATSDALYDSQSGGITWSVPLADGTRFPVVASYSKSQSHAAIVRRYIPSIPTYPSLGIGSCRCLLYFLDCRRRAPVRNCCAFQLGVYLFHPNVSLDVRVQYPHSQESEHVRADACCFLFCLSAT